MCLLIRVCWGSVGLLWSTGVSRIWRHLGLSPKPVGDFGLKIRQKNKEIQQPNALIWCTLRWTLERLDMRYFSSNLHLPTCHSRHCQYYCGSLYLEHSLPSTLEHTIQCIAKNLHTTQKLQNIDSDLYNEPNWWNNTPQYPNTLSFTHTLCSN